MDFDLKQTGKYFEELSEIVNYLRGHGYGSVFEEQKLSEKTDLPSLEGQPIETNGAILTGLDLRTPGVQKRLERDLWCAKGIRKGPLVL